jgi:CMP-N-acetylneuraminic acid synthetase
MNGYNMIITSDHGYLYQHNRLDESDFTDFTPAGNVYKSSRRFILGKDLTPNISVQKWSGPALGLGDETEVQVPKSINRIRIQGAGSRFVHGGSSLQEIVVPVLEINKARKSDIEQVEIDIISGSSNITSNTFAVSFYQKQPVTEKVQVRQIKAAFYTGSGQLISDVKTLMFNSSENDAMELSNIKDLLFKIASRNELAFDYLWLIQPTTPFRRKEEFKEIVNLIDSKLDWTSIVSVKEFTQNHPSRMFKLNSTYLQSYTENSPEDGLPRQLLSQIFIKDGGYYVFKKQNLINQIFLGSKVVPFHRSSSHNVNIDTPDDLDYARYLAHTFELENN